MYPRTIAATNETISSFLSLLIERDFFCDFLETALVETCRKKPRTHSQSQKKIHNSTMSQQQQDQANKLKQLLNKLRSDLIKVEKRRDESNTDKERELQFLQETEIEETAIMSSIAKAKLEMKKTKKHVQDVRSRIQVLRDEHYRLEGKRCEMEWTCFDLIRVFLFRDLNPISVDDGGNVEEEQQENVFQKAFYENRKDRRSTARLGMIQSALQVARSYFNRLYERREALREEKQNLDFQTKSLKREAQRVRDTIVMFEDKLTSLDVTHQIEMEKRDQALERLTLIEQRRASSDYGVSDAVAV